MNCVGVYMLVSGTEVISMEIDGSISLSTEAKINYLEGLRGQIIKVLHLIEEQKDTGYSPELFILGRLFELNSANDLFDGKLVNIIVKLNGIVTNYENLSFAEIKRQIFEIKKNINFLLKELKGR